MYGDNVRVLRATGEGRHIEGFRTEISEQIGGNCRSIAILEKEFGRFLYKEFAVASSPLEERPSAVYSDA